MKRALGELNRNIGNEIRARRRQCGLSQTEVAEQLGVSFQQLQKYERGINRISAARLIHIAQILDADFMAFIPAPHKAEATDERSAISRASFAIALRIEALPPGQRRRIKALIQAMQPDSG